MYIGGDMRAVSWGRNPQNCYDKHKMSRFRTYRTKTRRKAKQEQTTSGQTPPPHSPETEKQEDEKKKPRRT